MLNAVEDDGRGRTSAESGELVALASLSGTGLPSGRLFEVALDQARRASEPWMFNHVVRSWLFATHIARDAGIMHDGELLALGALLHDLGLSADHPGPHRFEVNGADAALEILSAEDPTMCRHRRQLVWDCIALHSTGSIARHKQAEVALVNAGVAADYGGVGLDRIGQENVDAIVNAYPRLEMKRRFSACLCCLATTHPTSTYGTWVADFGVRFVEGYSAPSSVDALVAAPFDE
ncbi:HD domain-containing protein [Sphingomonas sp. UYAg733]